MIVIANNLGFRNRKFINAVKSGDKAAVAAMAEELRKAGADMIGVNLSLDGDKDELYMRAVVEAVQSAGLPLVIDSRNPVAHFAAVKTAQVPVTLNYVSGEPSRSVEMDEVLKVAADNKTDVVFYAMKKGTPADADERLQIIDELMYRAYEAGITHEHIIIDPVILHIGGGAGQGHALAVQQTLTGIKELIEPPVRTTCWLSNISAGAPAGLRPSIDGTFLAMLAGLGLWSVFMDALQADNMRTVRLIRALRNETLYSLADAA